MSNEKPDEFLSWRARLSRPDALPEQGLDDRELSWEKLAERLREKPRRRRTAYWIAAACLLLLAPVAHLFHERRAPLAPHSSVRPQARPEKVAAASGPAPEKVMGSRTGIQTVPGRARFFHRAAAAVPPPLARLDGRRPSIAGPSITEPVISATDTVNRLIAQRPVPKKPLRIISLNEIDKEGATPSMSTGRAGFFHIGKAILGREVFPDPASRQDQDYLLKINLSSSSQNR
jgi:hypothetical protein